MGRALNKKQKLMLDALDANCCNVSDACQGIGITRMTHYRWLESNELYKERYTELQESLIDYAESRLRKNIEKGDVRAIEFFLKSKGRSRGYGERIEIESSNKHMIFDMDEVFTDED